MDLLSSKFWISSTKRRKSCALLCSGTVLGTNQQVNSPRRHIVKSKLIHIWHGSKKWTGTVFSFPYLDGLQHGGSLWFIFSFVFAPAVCNCVHMDVFTSTNLMRYPRQQFTPKFKLQICSNFLQSRKIHKPQRSYNSIPSGIVKILLF